MKDLCNGKDPFNRDLYVKSCLTQKWDWFKLIRGIYGDI